MGEGLIWAVHAGSGARTDADAQSAQEFCQKQIANGDPFDTNDPTLQRVREHIGND